MGRRPVLLMAPWRRGPLLLLRRSGVALALAAAALVVALPAAAAPLFLSSARSATLWHGINGDCRTSVGPSITSALAFPVTPEPASGPLPGPQMYRERLRQADRAAARIPGLGPSISSVWVTTQAQDPHGGTVPLTLASRTGFADHVVWRTAAGAPAGSHATGGGATAAGGAAPGGAAPGGTATGGPAAEGSPAGAWIPDSLAEMTGLTAGQELTVVVQRPVAPGETVQVRRTVPIAGVYRDLRRAPDTPYWCLMKYVYRGPPGSEYSNRFVPPMVLMDASTLLGVLDGTALTGTHVIEYPLADRRLTQPQAVRMNHQIARMRDELYTGQLAVFRPDWSQNTFIRADIGKFADRAELVRRSLMPPVLPITTAGVLVGLLVVVAAAVFWVQRRRTELAVLAVRGVRPAALGVKAATEALPALLAGASIGWLAAGALVGWAGPSPLLSAEAAPLSLLAAAAAVPVALLVLGATAAAACRGLADQRPHRAHRARLLGWPWELLLVAASLPVWLLLGGRHEISGAAGTVGSVAQVPGRLLVVPIMAIAGTATFCARQALRWLRVRGRGHTPRRPVTFLAWRRTTREAAVAATLAAAIATPVGFAAYGATVTGSVHATLAAEARTRNGADVVLTLARHVPLPAWLAGRATEVLRLDGTQVNGLHADLLAIDPATFARDAFWDDRLAGMSMARIVDRLRDTGSPAGTPGTAAPAGTPTFPAVGSGPLPGGGYPVSWSGQTLGTAELSHVPVLPAEQGGYPVILASRDAIPARYLREAVVQLWVRGDPAGILHAASVARLPLTRVVVADEMYANTLFEPLTYTFDYLVALSLLTGAIAVVGLLLYLEGRAPRHRRAYVLLRRMGMRTGAHRRAVLLEVLLPMLAGLVGGLAFAVAMVRLLAAGMDVNPGVPPGTVVSPPLAELAGIAAAVAGVGVLAAWYAHHRVSSARPSEVLREIT